MMKKLLFTSVLLSFALALAAQNNRQANERMQDRVQAYRIAFFTEKLQLTPDESKAFWPLYNQYEDEEKALRDKYDLAGKKLELMSDSEIEGHIMKQLDAQEQQVKLRRDYVRKFMQVLPTRKVAMLQQVDNEFKRTLLEELRQRRENRPAPQGGPRPNQKRN